MAKIKEIFSKYKSIVFVILLILLGFWYFSRSGSEIEPLISGLDGSKQVLGRELLEELERLKSLSSIKSDFFSNSSFISLKDVSVEVTASPVGKDNLFAR